MTPRAAAPLAAGMALSAILLAAGPSAPDTILPDPSASIGRYILEHIDRFATPEFLARKADRRAVQRAGYAGMLRRLLALDAPGALLAYLRTRMQQEYSLPHNTIYFFDDRGQMWPLPEDRAFPEDPWRE